MSTTRSKLMACGVPAALANTMAGEFAAVNNVRSGLDRAATLGSQVVANRTHYPFNGFSSGSSQATNYRSAHWTRRGGRVSLIRLVFNNSSIGASGETAGLNAHTVKASIEYNGVIYPVYFAGARTKTLAVDEQVISDAVAVSIPADTMFHVRTFLTTAVLGEKWPVAQAANTSLGEGFASTTDKSDDVAYTSFSSASVYCPSAILGYTRATDTANVMVIGSSSGWGQGDTAEAGYYDYGYISRALSNEYGYIKFTRASTAMSQYLTGAGYARMLAWMNIVKPTHIIHQLGSNDLTSGASLATMQSRLAEMWDILGSTGARVIQATYTPVTTSSDSWATLAGQTLANSNLVRIATNEWIRSVPSSAITGYLETCSVVESSPNSGLWQVNGTANAYTADGTHVTQLGHRETAATFNMATVLGR
jgi:lysophospholipase L1-like esterase